MPTPMLMNGDTVHWATRNARLALRQWLRGSVSQRAHWGIDLDADSAIDFSCSSIPSLVVYLPSPIPAFLRMGPAIPRVILVVL